ncbi:unnamed protein product [Gongylonema pulchrum]|uniref:ZP domain-containing protein n=1 Tax=Gongylonema pulchrum TaxID=637853 RepID=A0A183DXE8_9BILA|nr:unnamed protein product [Gongylonema pulchrum]
MRSATVNTQQMVAQMLVNGTTVSYKISLKLYDRRKLQLNSRNCDLQFISDTYLRSAADASNGCSDQTFLRFDLGNALLHAERICQ